jgi:hypothetical protein
VIESVCEHGVSNAPDLGSVDGLESTNSTPGAAAELGTSASVTDPRQPFRIWAGAGTVRRSQPGRV